MKITLKWLKEKHACSEGIEWFKKQKKSNAIEVLESLIEQNQLEWANWTIVNVMKREQYLAYAIYAAEQVIEIYEKKYPKDNRPRKAIEAARAVLKNDTRDAAWAARDAAEKEMKLKILAHGMALLRGGKNRKSDCCGRSSARI